jgi:dihydrofolate reductase
MRKLKIFEHISLDGVIQSSGEDNFPYSDWTAPYRTPAGRDAVLALHGESFDLLLGRHTYDRWSGFWPKAPSSPMSDGLNAATKYVATHRPNSLAWGPFESLGPDIVEDVRRVKWHNGPDLILSGSSNVDIDTARTRPCRKGSPMFLKRVVATSFADSEGAGHGKLGWCNPPLQM